MGQRIIDQVIQGDFFKTGKIAKGFRQRYYSLEWGAKQFRYGKDSDPDMMDGTFDLARVKDAKLSLERKHVHHQKKAFSDSKQADVAGVISLTFASDYGTLFDTTRRFAVPALDEFHTLAYWLIVSIEAHTKYCFRPRDKELNKIDLSNTPIKTLKDKYLSVRTAMLIANI